MSKTISLTLTISEKHFLALKEFAASYDPKLEITWEDVARGWAKSAFSSYVQEHIERQRPPHPTKEEEFLHEARNAMES